MIGGGSLRRSEVTKDRLRKLCFVPTGLVTVILCDGDKVVVLCRVEAQILDNFGQQASPIDIARGDG
jgi:hypothetical protein